MKAGLYLLRHLHVWSTKKDWMLCWESKLSEQQKMLKGDAYINMFFKAIIVWNEKLGL